MIVDKEYTDLSNVHKYIQFLSHTALQFRHNCSMLLLISELKSKEKIPFFFLSLGLS